MSATNAMMLLPPAPGLCPFCATDHPSEAPHNWASLYYGMRFQIAHGRPATWADALAHCSAKVQALWKAELQRIGKWTQPAPSVAPIAEGVTNGSH